MLYIRTSNVFILLLFMIIAKLLSEPLSNLVHSIKANDFAECIGREKFILGS